MADLLTTIGLDDAQFRSGLQRVSQRVSNFSGEVKSFGSIAKQAFGGFGVGVLVGHLASAITNARQLTTEISAGKDELLAMGSAAIGSAKAMKEMYEGAFQGPSAAKVTAAIAGQANAIQQDAMTKIEKIGKTGFWEAVQHDLYADENTPYLTEEIDNIKKIADDKVAALTAMGNRVAKAAAEAGKKEQTATSQTLASRTADDYASYYADLSRQAEAARRLFTDDRAALLDGSGDSVGAEAARAAERRRQRIREMEDNDTLSAEQKRLGARYFGGIERFENLQAQAKYESQQAGYAKQAGSFSMGGSGSTFGQQIAGISNALGEAKKQSELQKEIAASLKALATDIGNRSFTTYN